MSLLNISKITKYTILMLIMIVMSSAFYVLLHDETLPEIPVPAHPNAQRNLPVIPLYLPDGRTLAVEVVRSEREMQRGLMFRDSVPPLTGMLFINAEEDYRSIWMKNTFVDLDIVFIGKNKKVIDVSRDVPASNGNEPEDMLAFRRGFGMYVLELAAGEAQRLGIERGTRLKFEWPVKP